MKNLLILFAVIGMVSCGTSEGECKHHETSADTVVVVKETTLDITEIETVGELLDTLESIPSEPVVE
jgi:hypothetical protein